MLESKEVFLNIKSNITDVPLCSPFFPIKEFRNKETKEIPVNTGVLRDIYNNRDLNGNIGTFFAEQSFAIHEYLYGWMCDFRPTWQAKWDAALAESDWEKISKLMHGVFAVLPQEEQTILAPAMPHLTPWQDELNLYWPSVWIVDRYGDRHGHIGMQIRAQSKDEALTKIPKGFELRCW
jgi:hypothetical protein